MIMSVNKKNTAVSATIGTAVSATIGTIVGATIGTAVSATVVRAWHSLCAAVLRPVLALVIRHDSSSSGNAMGGFFPLEGRT